MRSNVHVLASSGSSASPTLGSVRPGEAPPFDSDLLIQVGRLRRPPSGKMELEQFKSRQPIIDTLIEMRKAGIFHAVYCDDMKLAVVLPSESADLGTGIRQALSWPDASKMAIQFQARRARA
jgi:hypothetical protein